jgi:predicted nucleotidyltransferase
MVSQWNKKLRQPRAMTDGTVRSERLSPRRQRVSDEERCYLIEHWPLLAKLRLALRTEPNVRLAVLYGSVARGEDTPESDLDLLVSLAEDRPDAGVKLAVRLERALHREVDATEPRARQRSTAVAAGPGRGARDPRPRRRVGTTAPTPRRHRTSRTPLAHGQTSTRTSVSPRASFRANAGRPPAAVSSAARQSYLAWLEKQGIRP